ncbi:hypothetical protein ACH5RR_003439 [Cinchona calisaya]|uniref:Uncharacterized protein n=1 Tax=Cinchona calisaya TaxID=153742 RepID=A0ABD3AV80_9GENT
MNNEVNLDLNSNSVFPHQDEGLVVNAPSFEEQTAYFSNMDKPMKPLEMQLEEWKIFSDLISRKLANKNVTPNAKGRKLRRKKLLVPRSHAMATRASKQLPLQQPQ